MRYLPDTNAWIGFLRRKDVALTQRFERERPIDLALCSIVVGELAYGVHRSKPAFQLLNQLLLSEIRAEFASLPFDDRAAEEYGTLRALLDAAGTPIGPNDLMIAAIALAHRLIVVTHNVREFGRVPGLVVEDWQVP